MVPLRHTPPEGALRNQEANVAGINDELVVLQVARWQLSWGSTDV